MTTYNKRKPFKLHIAYLRNWESRAFQIATPRHIAFVASVCSLFGEMWCHDVAYITNSCTSFLALCRLGR